MNNKYKILLIDGEQNSRTSLGLMLSINGYKVITADSCYSAKLLFDSHLPDLAILALELPDEDGRAFLSYVRLKSLMPVIILTSRTDDADKVSALDMGANDYITKPFSNAEFLARIRVALRTSRHSNDDGRLPGGKFILDEMVIDYDARRVSFFGAKVKLTQTEYNILALLSEHCGKMMTYNEIIKTIWGHDADESSIKKLQVNMANIRKKFAAVNDTVNYIANELGVGYRMENDA